MTPDVYKTYGTATPTANSRNSSVSSNLTGDLGYRIKFASIQYNRALDWLSDATKGEVLQIGAIPNPMIPWEEHLTTFRYVTASPWNYVGLSSAQFGLSLGGPIKFHELQYVDYGAGVFTNAKYSQFEQSNTKQAMGRLSVYPFGSKWNTQGLGLTRASTITATTTRLPITVRSIPASVLNPSAFGHVATAHLDRWAAMIHYTAEQWGIAFEYDQGHNSFPGGNLFTGNGPTVFFTPPAAALTRGRNLKSVQRAVLQFLRDDGRAVGQQQNGPAGLRCLRSSAHPGDAVPTHRVVPVVRTQFEGEPRPAGFLSLYGGNRMADQ